MRSYVRWAISCTIPWHEDIAIFCQTNQSCPGKNGLFICRKRSDNQGAQTYLGPRVEILVLNQVHLTSEGPGEQ